VTFLLLSRIAAQPTIGQDLAGATPTTRVFPVFIDSRIEEPPVYSGVAPVPRPAADNSVRLQVLMPDAAALEAYGLTVYFENEDSTFSTHFEIVEVRSEVREILDDATLAPDPQALEMTSPEGSEGPLRAVLFLKPWRVSNTGLIAVSSSERKRTLAPRSPSD
tara:strand:+ start:2955 stop:3443 length:489 start_codon:yes stop_codon:yes gene_type:complete